MKKHLPSIESTRPAQQKSIFSSISRLNQLKANPTNPKQQFHALFKTLSEIITLRSHLCFRDIEQVYENCQTFLKQYLNIYSAQQFYSFSFNNKSQQDKLYEKQQIQMFLNIIYELNKLKNQSATEGRMEDFQHLKQLIELIETKSVKYQKAIKQAKEKQQKQMRLNLYKQQQKEFNSFQNLVKDNLKSRHSKLNSALLQKTARQQQYYEALNSERNQQFNYKLKPSKPLSEAKEISLRAKLAPYASQLKRAYDYRQLRSSLSKTVNLDQDRKFTLIERMKSIEKQKINKQHKPRYSVLQDRLQQEQNLTERQLSHQRSKLQKSFNNQLYQIQNKNRTRKNSILLSLKNSLNAFNMHSDSKQISKIINHHKNSLQFSNSIQDVANISTNLPNYQQKYGTISFNMSLSKRIQDQNDLQKSREERRILRRFSKHKNELLETDSKNTKRGEYEFDIINDKIRNQRQKIKRQKSLVALYDDLLSEKKIYKKDQ